MIIKEINIQNFKSYGNKPQKLSFDNDGKLILLYGKNGSGKSTILEVIDFSLYGIVRGKEKKKVSLKLLPNRINKNLFTSISFINEKNDDIEIVRCLEPNKYTVRKNNLDYTEVYKNLTVEDKENIIGFNYDIYKSFISLNMNDFLNFINIDTTTKKKLLDKLFNIQEINEYYDLTKKIIKTHEDNLYDIINKINTNKEILKTYEYINDDNISNKYDSFNEIKNIIYDKKNTYLYNLNKINEINDDIKNLNIILKNIDKEKEDIKKNIFKLKLDIKNTKEKINIFNNGICPICNSNLLDNSHILYKKDLINNNNIARLKIKEYKKQFENINKTTDYHKKELNLLYGEKNDIIKQNVDIKVDVLSLRKDYKSFINSNKKNIFDDIERIKKENKELNIKQVYLENEIYNYNILLKLFSEDGIKKTIIKNIVVPINNNLKKYLKKLESPFYVELDDEFNAIVYERKINIIQIESLSVGEMRKINIAIAMAYMESIFNVRKCNILFIDEVFSSIDELNVHTLLNVFKEFATEYNINIFIINHSFMDHNIFDKIYKVEKEMGFSNLIEIK